MSRYTISNGGMITDEDGAIIQLPWSWVFSSEPLIPGRMWDTLIEQGLIERNGKCTDKWRAMVREQWKFAREHWDEAFKE